MKRHSPALLAPLCIFLTLLCTPSLAETPPAGPVQVTDASGQNIRLEAPARRIVSIAPHVSELLLAAGAAGQLVGVDEFSASLPGLQSRQLVQVGQYARLDLERLLALQPDLVIGWQSGNRMPQLQHIRQFGIPLYLDEIRRIEDIAESVESLGQLAGQPQASTTAEELRQRVAALRALEYPPPRLRVFFQIWDQPLMTINGEHVISQAIELCGGENVFAGLPVIAPTVSAESVLAAQPDLIVVSSGDPAADASALEAQGWQALSQARRVSLTPSDILQRPSPRFIDGVESLCAVFDEVRQAAAGPDGFAR